MFRADLADLVEIGEQDRLAAAVSDEALLASEAARSDIRSGYLVVKRWTPSQTSEPS
ncbi:MAG: hypothetical protein LC799_02655 [Actinobacteria bacterium]|nr:hypothetical protein [Actinomycetota bacterium]